MKEVAAISSYSRGVTVEWLLLFTQTHNCWDWPTSRVNAEIIKPATVNQRCRYVELDHMKSQQIPGKADIFVSHTWGAKWGTLVAAVVDTCPPSARIWCDIFAVRQWPGSSYDLDFCGVIERVSGVLIVSEAVPLEIDMWIQFFVAIFCIVALIIFRDSFSEKGLVSLRKEIEELRRQRNRHPKNSYEWTDLHHRLKEKEQEYKDSLGANNLRW